MEVQVSFQLDSFDGADSWDENLQGPIVFTYLTMMVSYGPEEQYVVISETNQSLPCDLKFWDHKFLDSFPRDSCSPIDTEWWTARLDQMGATPLEAVLWADELRREVDWRVDALNCSAPVSEDGPGFAKKLGQLHGQAERSYFAMTFGDESG